MRQPSKLPSPYGNSGRVGDLERQARDVAMALAGRVDHRLTAVDGDHRPAGRDAPRQRRGVVPESASDLENSAARRGGEQVVAFALALGEERQ